MAPSEESAKAVSWREWSFDLLWWLGVTVVLGLSQVWLLLCIIWGLGFFPNIQQRIGNHEWGIDRILGSSVLLFFATSLLGQTIYTLSHIKNKPTRHIRFLWFFIGLLSVPLFILYVLEMLANQSPVSGKYKYDILYAAAVLLYTAYVEFWLRPDMRPAALPAKT